MPAQVLPRHHLTWHGTNSARASWQTWRGSSWRKRPMDVCVGLTSRRSRPDSSTHPWTYATCSPSNANALPRPGSLRRRHWVTTTPCLGSLQRRVCKMQQHFDWAARLTMPTTRACGSPRAFPSQVSQRTRGRWGHWPRAWPGCWAAELLCSRRRCAFCPWWPRLCNVRRKRLACNWKCWCKAPSRDVPCCSALVMGAAACSLGHKASGKASTCLATHCNVCSSTNCLSRPQMIRWCRRASSNLKPQGRMPSTTTLWQKRRSRSSRVEAD